MMKSMTAYGRAEKTVEGRSYSVEMRSVNRRYCEISVRMPSQLLPLEDRIKKLVADTVSRGRVDVTVRLKGGFEAVPEMRVDIPLAEAYYRSLSELRETLNINEEVGIQTLLGLEGIITTAEREVDLEGTWGPLSWCIDEALRGMDAMRISEGQAIFDDFRKRVQSVEEGLSHIKELAPSVSSEYYDRLQERIALFTEGRVELDPNRLAQEAAFLADKSDITEEIVRAESHLKQFRTMMERDGPAGRALDFLLQELNREINTIGSKGGDAQLSHTVVALKSELEKIREQVQNVE
ncbi:MAG: YicC/YloC family endoribonuclease [Thermodesulfobacteriota bacterium]|nr:YicC/YloC family endoribonuclease [Thermodesulfobacteriota bacterium]